MPSYDRDYDRGFEKDKQYYRELFRHRTWESSAGFSRKQRTLDKKSIASRLKVKGHDVYKRKTD